jgi:3-isopropylmalate/(R)-2-methylmalate dehydratase small subunit
MRSQTQISGIAAAVPAANIDTDVIMPKQFLHGIDRAGLAAGVFHNLRFDELGVRRDSFVLDQPGWAGASILVAGPNFGCGSSREHAVWGLMQFGIRAVVGTTFGAIFADNAANNGLLLPVLQAQDAATLLDAVGNRPVVLTILLDECCVQFEGKSLPIDLDEETLRMLRTGQDRIGETLMAADELTAFEADYLARRPWLVSQ